MRTSEIQARRQSTAPRSSVFIQFSSESVLCRRIGSCTQIITVRCACCSRPDESSPVPLGPFRSRKPTRKGYRTVSRAERALRERSGGDTEMLDRPKSPPTPQHFYQTSACSGRSSYATGDAIREAGRWAGPSDVVGTILIRLFVRLSSSVIE